MRHHVNKHSFGRKPGPKKALIRGLVNALVENERICTTLPKAKELRRVVEKAITLGKDGTLHNHRTLLSKYPNKDTVQKIVTDLSPRFKSRPGGYTRIMKAGSRAGDMAPMAYIEFVDYVLPEVTEDGEVKVDADPAKEKLVKQQAKAYKDKRKRLRKIKKVSRRINRK